MKSRLGRGANAPGNRNPTEHFNSIAAKASALGASLTHEVEDIPQVGRFTTVRDPQGVHFSVIQFLPQY